MKSLPILAVLFLTSSLALADGCPNLAGQFINLEESADIVVAQGDDAGVPFLSLTTLGSKEVNKFIVDGKEHEAVSDDGSKRTYLVVCTEGKLALTEKGSTVSDFHDGDGDDSKVPAVDPRMDAGSQAFLTMLHSAIKNKQSLELSHESTTELAPVNRDLQVKIVGKVTIKNLDTQDMKEFPNEESGVMKRDED